MSHRENKPTAPWLVALVVAVAATAAALFATAGGQAATAPGSPPSLSWSPGISGAFDFGAQLGAVSQQFTLTNSGGHRRAEPQGLALAGAVHDHRRRLHGHQPRPEEVVQG